MITDGDGWEFQFTVFILNKMRACFMMIGLCLTGQNAISTMSDNTDIGGDDMTSLRNHIN